MRERQAANFLLDQVRCFAAQDNVLAAAQVGLEFIEHAFPLPPLWPACILSFYTAPSLPPASPTRRFNTLLGHRPAEEIRRTKIERVRQLLTSTDMTVPDIAEACGFAYAEHMIPLFARRHGSTPAAFRRNLRGTSRLKVSGA